MTPDNPITSMSLIDQVRSENAEAWSKLGHIYYPLLFDWAKKAGLQDSDAADIVQDVFSIVFKSISRFHKDRPADTFRGWLWTITRNEIRGWFRKQKAMQAKARRLLRESSNRVRSRLGKTMIPKFTKLSQNSPTESLFVQRAAEAIRGTSKNISGGFLAGHRRRSLVHRDCRKLNMSTGAVHQAKFRVLARLREFLG